ncbi:hypothetical protein BDR26DRAFT_250109 [Obelidium mucronatum]|nr:hypothetical protein BDR26DRAFT_250109 [Obelidium mucronatum]
MPLPVFTSEHTFPPLTQTQLTLYLERIAFPQSLPLEPTLELLNSVAHYHSIAIPFETGKLTLCQIPGPIEIAEIFDEIVVGKRGGYCFQNNVLLLSALRALEFKVSSGIARFTVWNDKCAIFDIGPTAHMIVFVQLNDSQQYIVDMGNNRFSRAIEIRDGSTQVCAASESFQIRKCDGLVDSEGGWMLWVKRAPWAVLPNGADDLGYAPLFYFTLARYRPQDYLALNVFVTQWPQHALKNTLIVSIVTETYGRAVITDSIFRRREGKDNRNLEYVFEMKSVRDLVGIMQKEFGVVLTQGEIDGAQEKYFKDEKVENEK